MPVIESVANPNDPLCQGDILKGVTLFSTRGSEIGDGGTPHREESSFCIVLSRPCVAVRAEWVVVSAVEVYKNRPPSNFGSFDECRSFFVDVRDGYCTPDQFYLGQLPGNSGPYCARFDSIFRIQIPKTPLGRSQFIERTRVARLHRDFVRDLHIRLTRAFASLGFDDHAWFSTEDLQTCVSFADRDEAKKDADLQDARARLQLLEGQGTQHPSTKFKVEKEVQQLQSELTQLKSETQPYRIELARRTNPPSSAEPL